MDKAGEKYDEGKPNVGMMLASFPNAIRKLAALNDYGAALYTPEGWKEVPDGKRRYAGAAGRHMLDVGPDLKGVDKESGALHLIAVAWNCLATVELMHQGGDFNREGVSIKAPTLEGIVKDTAKFSRDYIKRSRGSGYMPVPFPEPGDVILKRGSGLDVPSIDSLD